MRGPWVIDMLQLMKLVKLESPLKIEHIEFSEPHRNSEDSENIYVQYSSFTIDSFWHLLHLLHSSKCDIVPRNLDHIVIWSLGRIILTIQVIASKLATIISPSGPQAKQDITR